MKKGLFLTTLILFVLTLKSYSQSKMIVGKKHTIFAEIPKNWLQAQNNQLPFFIKPEKSEVSAETYIYVYGLDYNSNPNLNDWINGNNKHLTEKFEGIKIDKLDNQFDNLKSDDYLTGNYKIVTYEYPNGRKEAMLVIECKNTIATIVLSTKDNIEFNILLPSFIELSKSIKVLGTTLKD